MMVLVNGRRITKSFLGADEIHLFPVSAIERIEILSGGSAGVHGGDSSDRAINIVTRRKSSTSQVHIYTSQPKAASGDAEHASRFLGEAMGDAHVTFGTELVRRQEILDADRDYGRPYWNSEGSFADVQGVSVSGYTFFYTHEDNELAGYLEVCEADRNFVGPLAELYGVTGECRGFANATFSWQWSSIDRKSIFSSVDVPLDDNLELQADVRIRYGKNIYIGASRAYELSVDASETPRLVNVIHKRYPNNSPAD